MASVDAPQLYDPSAHEPLCETAWSETAALEAVREIIREAVAAFDDADLYPAHPLDSEKQGNLGTSHYIGAGGVLWAIDWLRRQGAVETDVDWIASKVELLVERAGHEPGPMPREVSYLVGDLPLLMQAAHLTAAPSFRDRLEARFQESVDAPIRELMWGTPGVLVASGLLGPELRGVAREADRANVAKLLAGWCHERAGLIVWNEELYGRRAHYHGLVHGTCGQIFSLLKRLDLLDADQRASVIERARAFLLGTALRQGDLANWPAWIPGDPPGSARRVPSVQVCHGAPGVLIGLSGLPPDAEVDAALLAGGELIWRAGPLVKGSNLCHGTAGNGFAFLKLLERTGDSGWLARARRFAMHEISQVRAARARHGRGRFSLWTGDPGLAVYLWSCVTESASFPTLDVS